MNGFSRILVRWLPLLFVLAAAPRGFGLQCEYALSVHQWNCGASAYTITPLSISNTGVAVGYYTGCGNLAFRSFRWSAETGFQHMSLGGGLIESRARAISPNGEYVVGTVQRAGDYLHRAYLWKDGTYVFIEPPDPNLETLAYGVFDDGTVIGDLFDMWSGPQVFAWRDGAYLPLPPGLEVEGQRDRPLGARYPFVSGWLSTPGVPGEENEGFLWNVQTGSVELLPKLPTLGLTCHPSAVNASGQAVGYATEDIVGGPEGAAHYLPACWRNGILEMVEMNPNHKTGRMRAINEVGQFVGFTQCKWLVGCDPDKDAVWINSARVSLDAMVPSDLPGTLNAANSINDHGVILGVGTISIRENIFLFTPLGLIDEDVTIDCRVDADDLLMLLDCWGPTAESPIKRADVDRDGVIGPADVALLLGAWSPKVEKKTPR